MTAWLKVIGTSKWPLRDDWANEVPSLLQLASFGKRPGSGSFIPGDEFAYYALRGDISRVVAIGRVVDDVYYNESRDPGWPWLVPVEIEAKRDLISTGVPLDDLNIHRRLTRSVSQKSHIRLTPAEFRLAREAYGLA